MTCMCNLSIKVIHRIWATEPEGSVRKQILVQIDPLLTRYPNGGDDFIQALGDLLKVLDRQNIQDRQEEQGAQDTQGVDEERRSTGNNDALATLHEILNRYGSASLDGASASIR